MKLDYFKGKRILITGASSGIGKAIVEKLAVLGGVSLIISARRMEELEGLKKRLENMEAKIHVIVADLSSVDGARTLARKTEEYIGGIDILFNNAGFARYKKLVDLEDSVIEDIFSVNALSPIIITKYLLPGMLAQRSGHIVNINSVVGKRGYPFISAYCASKGALNRFSESLRMETRGKGIIVSEIFPAATLTPFVENSGVLEEGIIEDTSSMLSVESVVDEILFAVASKKREHIFGLKGKLLPILNSISPAFLDRYL